MFYSVDSTVFDFEKDSFSPMGIDQLVNGESAVCPGSTNACGMMRQIDECSASIRGTPKIQR
jgi:hypothetical protein